MDTYQVYLPAIIKLLSSLRWKITRSANRFPPKIIHIFLFTLFELLVYFIVDYLILFS
jgi:hypothetical protein